MRVLAIAAAVILAGVGLWFALSPHDEPATPHEPPAHGEVWFEDVAEPAGIRFRHHDPATPLHLLPETIGSGIAWIDYDADGWPDLFCVQDGPLPPAAPNPALTHGLYRNNRDGTFTDVSAASGLNRHGFGVGCAVGDYDNDGFDDLVLTSLGSITLFRNEPDPAAPGGRRFRDVTPDSGLANPHYGTSCAWGDLDGDGLLDLYVCNYAVIDPAKPEACRHPSGAYSVCSPLAFPYVHHKLFRNRGAGRFEDVSPSSGIAAVRAAPGLGVAIADLDADGRADIYVANDMSEAYLLHNLGNMKFAEIATRAGAGLGPNGARIAGMGIALGDLDGSARPSLVVTNFQDGPNVFFLNRGKMIFDDASMRSGLGGPSLSKLGFGVCPLDANLDSHLDLAMANGHVSRVSRELFGAPYAQESQLFLGSGSGSFRDASGEAGADFLRPRVGRGLATADYDGDGRPDLALSGVGEKAALLRNRTESTRNWINLELVGNGKTSNRNAIGSMVEIVTGGRTQTHFIAGGGSYLSASDRRLAIGLGDTANVERVVVRWPSGVKQEFRDLAPRGFWRLTEGRADPEHVRGK